MKILCCNTLRQNLKKTQPEASRNWVGDLITKSGIFLYKGIYDVVVGNN